MKRNFPVFLVGAIAVLITTLTIPSQAHHAWSAEYDSTNQRELRGVVTRVEWTNPHVRFYVDVTSENGEVTNWDLELQSANTLTRNGWTRHALSAGDEVVVDAYLARDGSNRANARGNLRLADGSQLFAGEPE
jgi:hypothetical protein